MTLEQILDEIDRFNKQRDWDQFHSPANLAKSIAIEAGELLEHFQFDTSGFNKEATCEELADVLAYALMMCQQLDVDPCAIIHDKMQKNAAKYPVAKAKGSNKKYSEL